MVERGHDAQRRRRRREATLVLGEDVRREEVGVGQVLDVHIGVRRAHPVGEGVGDVHTLAGDGSISLG